MKNIKLLLIALLICFSFTGCSLKKTTTTSDNNKSNDAIIEENNTNKEDNANTVDVSLKINQAKYNNVVITFPATKESFNGTNWSWDSSYAKKDLATGFTTSGGRIGSYPGGVVVGVINKSGQTKKIEDCTINSATFYNPKDGSENVYFIGGLNYTSTESDVTNTMTSLGYKNVKTTTYDRSSFYRYYLDDDKNNYRDYIEFYFFDKTVYSITVNTSI